MYVCKKIIINIIKYNIKIINNYNKKYLYKYYIYLNIFIIINII